ncbi:glycogenin-1-like isoform X2 [Amphiura filiformis]|uniref:glycogenin-1-like isoform X2 n=1 Tax=Amphiura filiformis TaxID=82378 RepID=UPI003B2236C5
MARREDQAFVTLATNDQYCYGALVLGQSLRDNGTTRQLAIMVTPQVSQPMRQQLSLVYDDIRQVDPLDSHDEAHLALLTRPELGITFSKLHCWRLTQYSKCVFLDADTLVLHNVDDLFDREEFSAAPDVGWPDCFNSGVFVFKPSEDTYNSLLQCAVTHGSFDGGDQGLLNTFFSGWATQDIRKHLPFIYNMTSNISYTYKPALLRFGESIKIVHFIGTAKPWRYTYNTLTSTVSPPAEIGHGNGHQLSYVQAWWNVFMSSIKPRIEQAQARQEYLSTFPQSLFPTAPPATQTTTTVSHLSNLPSNSDPFPAETPLSSIGTTIPDLSNTPSSSIPIGGELAVHFDSLNLESSVSSAPREPGSPRTRQHAWEQGEVDYMGSDSFEKIHEHIQEKINGEDKDKDDEKK